VGDILVGRRLSETQWRAARGDPDVVDRHVHGAAESSGELDLEMAWHGVHWLLTGTAEEVGEGAGAAVLGGEPVGYDFGLGPPRLLMPDAVREIAAALDALPVRVLRARYDPVAMTAAEIYPNCWEGDQAGREFDGYLRPAFIALRDFYRAAADDGHAVLLAVA
jgi:hypothetical protein